MPTNFDLAPPAKTVDGLAAVPIDIQHITGVLIRWCNVLRYRGRHD